MKIRIRFIREYFTIGQRYMTSEIKLYPCEPVFWKFLTKTQRYILGWITIELFVLSFFALPACIVFALPITWRVAPRLAAVCLLAVILSMIWPMCEWPITRKLGQLWYEIFQFSCNLPHEELMKRTNKTDEEKFIMAMHPHGIVPFQAIIWAAYCDQYFNDPATGKALYGFGAVASVIGYLPFLRNMMGWMAAGPADYKTLKKGLMHGDVPMVNAAGRRPRHLYILPGGIAEIFVSTPGKHAIVFKSRKGLCKLSIETGAKLTPCYVFGGTDFFQNLATGDGWLCSLSRSLKMGIAFFYGPFGLPVPFAPRVSMVIGEPITPPKGWDGKGSIPSELIDELHETFMKSMVELFDSHKAICGYPDAKLDIL